MQNSSMFPLFKKVLSPSGLSRKFSSATLQKTGEQCYWIFTFAVALQLQTATHPKVEATGLVSGLIRGWTKAHNSGDQVKNCWWFLSIF